MSADRQVLFLFTKPAVPGRVKTRLTPQLTPHQAAGIHLAMLEDLSRELENGAFDLEVAWALEDNEACPDGIIPLAVPSVRQVGRDLGERLFAALSSRARQASAVAAVGSDHPLVSAALVEDAFNRCREVDVVLGPANDGGYYLIVVRSAALHPRLFEDIAWSTEAVLEQTRRRCSELGLSVATLEPSIDVDTVADLWALEADLDKDPAARLRCPRTVQLLAELSPSLKEAERLA